MSIHPKDLTISDYTYPLPEDRIAKNPLLQRDDSKLLIYRKGEITESAYRHLASHLPDNTLLVFNNTKVVEARIIFNKPTGGEIEIFCLEPDDKYADITTAMLQKGYVLWKCLVGGAKKWKETALTKQIVESGKIIKLSVQKVERRNDYFLLEFSWDDVSLTFVEILHLAGLIPLPPYLNRKAEETDKVTYQTIYAQHDGSVAAPTAGLHFTNELFNSLLEKGIKKEFVTLHVGAGTFKPVKAATMEEHEMHAEFIDVSISFIETLLTSNDTVIPVGTTSLRTLESIYWLGVKINNQSIFIVEEGLGQWDAYNLPQNISKEVALTALINWMQGQGLKQLITKTQLLIAPNYQLRIAKALITNFHQPQSTLLLLVAAIIGNDWRRMYDYALDNDFRFLSYGDGCLLIDI